MKLIPIGTGSAFTMDNYQTNLLIEHNGKRILIDAGGDVRFALKDQGLSYKDIDAVYLTHLHADHLGGVEYLAFTSYFDPQKGPQSIEMFGHQRILEDAWNASLRGGLRSVQGKVINLHDYFSVKPLSDNGSFFWEGIHFDIVQSVHIMDGYSIVPSYGLMIHIPESTKKIYYTADAQHNPNQIQDFYNEADLIIQDCETAPFQSGVHAHYDELKTLSSETKNKMMLIHYQDNVLADLDTHQKLAKKDGFKGFAEKGKEIKL